MLGEPGEGPLVVLVTDTEAARCCPQCGRTATRSKGRATTRPRDLPVGGRLPRLVWHKRRWYCDEPTCARRSFTEAVSAIPARARLTCPLRQTAGLRWPTASAPLCSPPANTRSPGRSRPPRSLRTPCGCCPSRATRGRCWASTRSAAVARASCSTRSPECGVPAWIGGRWDLSTCLAVRGCSDRSRDAQRVQSPRGSTRAARRGRTASSSSRSICAHGVQGRGARRAAAGHIGRRPLPCGPAGQHRADRGAPPGHHAGTRPARAQRKL